ncbi:hypothetical protein [Streptomyces sp. NPDC002088]|uniref:hypothetical protein n=1 Tax=Streptomyces sp. NPDC002088 TaxID=3154665 RepID=UPI00331CC146
MPRSRCGTSSTTWPATCPAARGSVPFPLRFHGHLLGQPARDPLGNSEFLQLVAHLLKLLAQLLSPRLQFSPAGP